MIQIPRPNFTTIYRAISDCEASNSLQPSAVRVLARYVEDAICRDLDNWERRVGEVNALHERLSQIVEAAEEGTVRMNSDELVDDGSGERWPWHAEWLANSKTTLTECEEIKF